MLTVEANVALMHCSTWSVPKSEIFLSGSDLPPDDQDPSINLTLSQRTVNFIMTML